MGGPEAEDVPDGISKGEAERTEPLLSVGDVANMLNIHANTVRKWSELGILQCLRVGPKSKRRFRQEDIETIIFEQINSQHLEKSGNFLICARILIVDDDFALE